MLLALLGCTPEPTPKPAGPPFGMILKEDDQLYAGAARIEITPEIIETYFDKNENNQFDGCMTDPAASRDSCNGEWYDDVNGNGHFDAVWIAGFQSSRAAKGVHDPLTVTAVVLSLNGDYFALVGVDALGVLENRIRDARDSLEADGFDRDRVIVSSSHAHSAPDTAGIYGRDEDVISGIYPPFIESIAPAIHDAIEVAAGSMVAVSPKQGAVHMTAPEMNGVPFGGINPDTEVEGLIHDIRDPMIAADQVLSIALDGKDGRVATIVSNSGHPETSGDEHSLLSADYPGVIRDWIDTHDGGVTLFMSGALGGMQSALGGTLPMVDESGALVKDDAGEQTWISGSSWEFVRVYGTLIAEAAESSWTDATPWDAIKYAKSDFLIPVDNTSFKLAFQVGLIDTPDEYVVQDSTCPGYGTNPDNFGCVPASSWMLQLGPTTFGSVPGELVPELFWGVPDEPAMVDDALRQDDRRWVQEDPECIGVPYESCRDTDHVNVEDCDGVEGTVCDGVCDCLHTHVAPYVISSDPNVLPIVDMLPGTFKAPIGIANAYCGYIVPEPDFSTYVSVLTEDGDHYEETNSCSRNFAPLVQKAFQELTK